MPQLDNLTVCRCLEQVKLLQLSEIHCFTFTVYYMIQWNINYYETVHLRIVRYDCFDND